ncbi:MAG: glyoxylase-like metal-dependent hydrolase (beta-lactamase superfamily II) [Candidatus Azotimanducaceae bacterium]|jgi:glyoxylase-like metal-dependent hydrolase (beta-lactamase superfamily II)
MAEHEQRSAFASAAASLVNAAGLENAASLENAANPVDVKIIMTSVYMRISFKRYTQRKIASLIKIPLHISKSSSYVDLNPILGPLDRTAGSRHDGRGQTMNGVNSMLSWQIGNVRITQVVELVTATVGAHILPDATPERMAEIPWIGPFVDDANRPILSMHSLIVESRGQTIMVDTCIGNDKVRHYPKWHLMQSDFLHRLSQAGYQTDDIDTVLCTHLHVDHVGWNTRLQNDKWVPTFMNAEYLFAEPEFNFWRAEEQSYGPVFEDSVQPVFDAGKAVLVQPNHQVTDEVWFEPTPGHTPGHVSIHIQSRGEEAVITGDLAHHPCQIAHRDWRCTADHDAQQAYASRDRFVRTYADRPVLIIGTHFAGPTAGRIVTDGNTFRLDYS